MPTTKNKEKVLSEFINKVINELQVIKDNPNKSNYIIDELTVDMSFTFERVENDGLSISVLGVSGNMGDNNKTGHSNRVVIKMRPKK